MLRKVIYQVWIGRDRIVQTPSLSQRVKLGFHSFCTPIKHPGITNIMFNYSITDCSLKENQHIVSRLCVERKYCIISEKSITSRYV